MPKRLDEIYLNHSQSETFINNVIGIMKFRRMSKNELSKGSKVDIYRITENYIISEKTIGRLSIFLDVPKSRLVNSVDTTKLNKTELIDWITCEYTHNK